MNATTNQSSLIKVALSIAGIVLITPLLFIGYRHLTYKQINGKVLIVQKNADVKKLALIQIEAVDAQMVAQWKSNVNEQLRKAIEAIHAFQRKSAVDEAEIVQVGEKRVSNALDCINRTEEAVEISRKIWLADRNSSKLRLRLTELLTRGVIPKNDSVLELAKNNNWQDTYRFLSSVSLAEAKRIHELAAQDYKATLEAHQSDYKKELSAMRDALENIIPLPTVKSLPKEFKASAHDVTDETGSFTLNVSPGDYYIFAEGHRSVGFTTEHYFWAHPITVPSQESDKCLIGNLNLDGESTARDDLWFTLRQSIEAQKKSIRP